MAVSLDVHGPDHVDGHAHLDAYIIGGSPG
jgi:hypothetical protein